MELSQFGEIRRPLFWICLAFLCGAAAAMFLMWYAALPVCAAFALVLCWLSLGRPRFFLPLLTSAALLGWGAVLCHQFLLTNHLLPLLSSGEPLTVRMTVEEALHNESYCRYEGPAVVSNGSGTFRIQLAASGFCEGNTAPGETLYCTAVCPDPPDLRSIMTGELRLQIRGLLPGDPPAPDPLSAALTRLRAGLARHIVLISPGDTGSVLAAMLVGDQSYLSDSLDAAFRRSGLSHLLVVSGMHLVILSRFLSFFLLPLGKQRLSALLMIAFCWGYSLLTGAGNSVIRAAAMLTLTQIAPLFNRQGDTLTSLSVAGVVMTLANPGVLLTASFQLSFGAVAGLALLEAPISRTLSGAHPQALPDPFADPPAAPGPIRSYLSSSLAAGIAAQIGASPALLGIFGLFPLLGIAANLLVVGLIAPMMTLGLLVLLLSLVLPGVASLLLPCCQGLALVLITTARIVSGLPFAQVGIDSVWQYAGLAGLLGLLIVLLARRPKAAVVRTACLGWCAVFLTVCAADELLSRNRADLLLTESGVSCIAYRSSAVILGAPEDLWESERLADAMTRIGVQRIDAVILERGEAVDLAVFALLNRFDGSRRIAASDSFALRRFCSAAGMIPCEPPAQTLIFSRSLLTEVEGGYQISFSDASLLKSNRECAIIGKYTRALSLGEEICHIRVRLEEGHDPAK